MTYLELFNKLKEINKDTYLDEIIYEFIYDEYVFDLLTFVEFRHKFKKDYKKVINKFQKVINNKIPWERILKYCYFLNLKIKLNKNVFSPRKDTEFLVNCFLVDNPNLKNQTILDLGTGSGCISLAIACNIDNSNLIIGYENNNKAVKNTLINFKNYNKKIKLIKKDYLKCIAQNKLINCDYIICNPPYINQNYQLDNNVIKYDPKSALFSNDDEIKYYKRIIEYFNKQINIKKLYFEIGYNQKQLLIDFLNNFKNLKYEFKQDLNNLDRVLIVSR